MTFLGVASIDYEATTWYLQVLETYLNDTTAIDSITGNAVIDSTQAYIGVPQSIYDDLNLFEAGFFCTSSDTPCQTLQSCNVAASYVSPITITFDGSKDYGFGPFNLSITPEFYLYQNWDTGYCE